MADDLPPITSYEQAVRSVLRLHSKRVFDGDGYGWALCAECRQSWPCATVQAIHGVGE
jgi:hypothetical protein